MASSGRNDNRNHPHQEALDRARARREERATRPSAEERDRMEEEWRQKRLDAAKRRRDNKKQAKAEFAARQAANGGPSEEYLAEKAKVQARIANNERIVADRGSDKQINFQKDLEKLKQETGYGTGGTGDIRQHLRENIEKGYVVNNAPGRYMGRSWAKGPAVKGNPNSMDYLKEIAYGDTPVSWTDVENRNTEGYVPMAERDDVTWKMWTPSGGSDKDAYFKGEHALRVKHGYTDLDFDTWNTNRIQGNRQLANRHKKNTQNLMDNGLIDKYGNPIPPDY